MKTKQWLLYVLMGAAFTFTSCVDSDKELYEPKDEPDQSLPEISSDFDWNLTKTIDVTVDVADLHYGKYFYDVKVFNQEPKAGIFPIASGIASEGIPYMGEVTVAKDLKTLYIQQSLIRPDGSTDEIKTKATGINGTTANVVFEKVTTRGMKDDYNDLYKEIDITLTSSYTEKLENGKVYYIPKGETYTFNQNGGLTKASFLIDGELKLNAQKCKFNDEDTDIFVSHTGKITSTTGVSFEIGSHAELDNYGTIQVDELTLTGDAELDNAGCIFANIINYDTTPQKKGDQDRLEGDEDSYIECKTLNLLTNNGIIELETGSRLYVREELNIKGNDFKIEQDDNDKNILFQIDGTINTQGNGSLTTGNNITVVYKGSVPGKVKFEKLHSTVPEGMKFPATKCADGIGTEVITEKGSYIYAMEDQYPELGDYDMNDIVLETTFKTTEANGSTKGIQIDGKLRAIGAQKKIAVFYKINNVNDATIEVNGKSMTATENDGGIIIPVFSDVHEAFNVSPGEFVNVKPVTTLDGLQEVPFSVVIKLNEQKRSVAINDNDIEFYITANGQEIHLPNGQPGDIYRDPSGWVWGIRIPFWNNNKNKFAHPIEGTPIWEAYTKFKTWIKDNTTIWYKEPASNLTVPNS